MNALMLQFFVFTVAGWINRGQQDVIEYIREENRVLREQLGGKRLRLTDDQRRRLAVPAKALGRAALQGLTSIVTPDTLLAWYRNLVAAKYNGAPKRGPGRPPTGPEIADLSTLAHIAGIAHQVYGKWAEQVARNLTDPMDGFLKDMRYLIHDRDPVFTKHFAEILASAGVETVKLPARSPNLNSFAERSVRSVRDDCLRRVIPLGETHLRRIITEYVEHYHCERNHQGLDNQLIIAPAANENGEGPVQCRERLGGTLRFCYRDAA